VSDGSYARVAAIMPALNEAPSLRALLPKLERFRLGATIVVDNGSTDQTADVAQAHGCTVVREARRGYGAACWAGMQALPDDCLVVLFLDADSADDLSRLPQLVDPILDDDADLVMATRDAADVEPGSMSFQQRFGTRLAVALIRLRWGFSYRDLGPFRAVRRGALDRIAMKDRAFGWTVEMQIRAVQEKLRIRQVSVSYHRRIGRSKIGGTITGSIRAGYWILSTLARHW